MLKFIKYKALLFLLILVGIIGGSLFMLPTQRANAAPSNSVAAYNFQGTCDQPNLTTDNCGIIAYIVLAINILSGLVGIIIVIMLVYSGIRYTTARDDPQAVSDAKHHIRDAIIALIFYLVAFAFLQWLVPGGVF